MIFHGFIRFQENDVDFVLKTWRWKAQVDLEILWRQIFAYLFLRHDLKVFTAGYGLV